MIIGLLVVMLTKDVMGDMAERAGLK